MTTAMDEVRDDGVGGRRVAAEERTLPSFQGRASPPSAGFTLPDLLVIIGVIAMLALLWLPAQGALGRKAGVLECKNNLRQVGWAIDMYTRDHQDYLPGPIWSAVLYNYSISVSNYMAHYLRSYFGMPPPATYLQEVEVLKCPASLQAMPATSPLPPISLPVCFLTCMQVTNIPGPVPGDIITYAFGRPNSPYVPTVQAVRIRRPSEQWSVVDADKQNVPSSASYYNYLPAWPVHNNRPGGGTAPVLRNTLYFDGAVRGVWSAR